MRQFVESLGRLYATQKVSEELIRKLLSDKKIDEEEMDFIFNYVIPNQV